MYNAITLNKQLPSMEQNVNSAELEKHCVCLGVGGRAGVGDGGDFCKDAIKLVQSKESITFSVILCFMS